MNKINIKFEDNEGINTSFISWNILKTYIEKIVKLENKEKITNIVVNEQGLEIKVKRNYETT